MPDQDAADRRPRRALAPDEAGDGRTEGAATPSRARRSVEGWEPERDAPRGHQAAEAPTPDAPADAAPPAAALVEIQPATPPARDVQITTADPSQSLPAEAGTSSPDSTPPSDTSSPSDSSSPDFTPPAGPGSQSAGAAAWGRPGPMPTDPRPAASQPAVQRSASSPPPMWQEPHRHVLDRRTRSGLLLSAGVLLVVAVISVGFAVWANQQPQAVPPVTTTTSSTPSPSPTPVLNEGSMMTDADASEIDPDASWKVSLDADQIGNESPQATCIVADQAGLPTPESSRLRTLTTDTDVATAALHQADLYATSEDAQRVFESRLGQLGGCAKQPVYITTGFAPTDLGNQSGGVVAVVQDEVSVYHSLLLVRSGRIVNTIDVAQQRSAVDYRGLVAAASEVVNSQCGKTAGRCATDAESRRSVPPLGADQPGFLAGVDVPRITRGAGEWGGTPVESDFELSTSQCEGMNPANVSGPTDRAKVTYLLRNDPNAPQAYGFDEVVLTMEDAEAAEELREGYDEAVASCEEDLRTAEVSDPIELEGRVGDDPITGNAYTVTQSVEGSEDIVFRIALATVADQVVYLVLPAPPATEDFGFSNAQWKDIALRAAERATQGR